MPHKHWLVCGSSHHIDVVDLPSCLPTWSVKRDSGWTVSGMGDPFLCGLGVAGRASADRMSRFALLELPVYDFVAVYAEVLPFFSFIGGLCDICMSYWAVDCDASWSDIKLLVDDFPAAGRGLHVTHGLDHILLVAPVPDTRDVALAHVSWTHLGGCDSVKWKDLSTLFF